ncbi:MAG: transketolase family protein [Elusimicrobia bacterium]|nr:transketolase family protein [Candidatus Liberimonas magnetica]
MVEIYGKKATRYGYSEALVELGESNPKVVALAADTACSVMVHLFAQKYPERFIQLGIAEQNMIGVSAGLAVAGLIPFATTYAMFSTGRPWENIRNTICYSNLNVKIGGSHSGITVGQDGATHQALEDIAIMRCIPRMTVLVPCDMIQTKKATIAASKMYGPCYIRFGRETEPIITKEDTPFEIGKAQVLKEGKDIVIFACGYMVYESLMAAELLEKSGISAKVINIHTIKPLDDKAISAAAKECGAAVSVEEHQVIGGLGSAVAEVLAKNYPVPMEMIGINDVFGKSGIPQDLIRSYGLKDVDIAKACEKAIKRKSR